MTVHKTATPVFVGGTIVAARDRKSKTTMSMDRGALIRAMLATQPDLAHLAR